MRRSVCKSFPADYHAVEVGLVPTINHIDHTSTASKKTKPLPELYLELQQKQKQAREIQRQRELAKLANANNGIYLPVKEISKSKSEKQTSSCFQKNANINQVSRPYNSLNDTPFVVSRPKSKTNNKTNKSLNVNDTNENLFNQNKSNKSKNKICPDCHQTFKSNLQFSKHVAAEHGNPVYKCKIKNCTFQSDYPYLLKTHMEKCHLKGLAYMESTPREIQNIMTRNKLKEVTTLQTIETMQKICKICSGCGKNGKDGSNDNSNRSSLDIDRRRIYEEIEDNTANFVINSIASSYDDDGKRCESCRKIMKFKE